MEFGVRKIKCIECGCSDFVKLNESTLKCKVCNMIFSYPTPHLIQEFNEAYTCREIFDFERADKIYINILEKTDDEKMKVMCYFGRLLSLFGVSYIKDFDGNLVVSFSDYDPKYEDLKNSIYYKRIMNSKYYFNYENKLIELNEEYKRIKIELLKEKEYDVFICAKISMKTKNNPTAEGKTDDHDAARDLYDELTKRGLKVFYSDKSLKGINYDAQIYSALMRSKNILVIASKQEYLESPWVQSEWRRWLSFIERGIRNKDTFYMYILNNSITIPKALHKVEKFTDTLKLVNQISAAGLPKQNISVENKEDETIEMLLDKADVHLLLGEIKEAEEQYKNIAKKYLNDYRPWLGLIKILSEQNIDKNDLRYKKYVEKAMTLCKNEAQKIEISKICKVQFESDEELISEQFVFSEILNDYSNKYYYVKCPICKSIHKKTIEKNLFKCKSCESTYINVNEKQVVLKCPTCLNYSEIEHVGENEYRCKICEAKFHLNKNNKPEIIKDENFSDFISDFFNNE